MSAIGYLGSVKKSQDTAGLTASDTDSNALHRQTPAGETGAAETGRLLASGTDFLGELFGGGIHPETSVGVVAAHDLEKATDSVAGHFGGLIPRRGSTVSPGPGGAIVQPKVPKLSTRPPWLERLLPTRPVQ